MILLNEKMRYDTRASLEDLIEKLSKRLLVIDVSDENDEVKQYLLKIPVRRNRFSLLRTKMKLKRNGSKFMAEVKIRFPGIVIIFLLVFFGFIGLINILMIKSWFSGVLQFKQEMYVPIIMFFGGYALLAIGFKHEARKCTRILEEVFESEDHL